ncbi:MAG TPA: EcsC family protein [Tabrizicola sp.]|nr:EcsC family protein [Tabrizicola sp.]
MPRLPVPADLDAAIMALARRYLRANGPVIRMLNRFGGGLETQLAALPEGARTRIEALTAEALARSYGLAGMAPELGRHGTVLAALATGAAGGAGGMATSLAEIPVTVTLFLTAIQGVARAEGLDPNEDWVRAECLQVFAAGSPVDRDDGVNTGFVTARLALTGATVQNLIATIAPKLATVLGQKLAAQAVPVIGAVSGAALNAAYLSYYRELAEVRFALLRLAALHGSDAVEEGFRLSVTPPRILQA